MSAARPGLIALASLCLATAAWVSHHPADAATSLPAPTRAAVTAAIWDQALAQVNVPRDEVVLSISASPVSGWVVFRARPRNVNVPFQSGYGFLRERAGRWVVVADGSALVGCALPGVPLRYRVPRAVIVAAHEYCPAP